MKIKFTTELINKLKNYCEVAAIEVTGGKGSNKALYFAEEALSELLLSWHKKNENIGFKKKQLNDNYYFISCKNFVRNAIIKENRNKRKIHNDFNNLTLDTLLNDNDNIDVQYQLEDVTEKELNEVKYNDMIASKQLKFIVKTLENCEWINKYDIDVFHHVHVEGNTLKSYAQKNGCHTSLVSKSNIKVKNVIQYLWEDAE